MNRLDIIAEHLVRSLERADPNTPSAPVRPRRTPRRDDNVTQILDGIDVTLDNGAGRFVYRGSDGREIIIGAATRALADVEAKRRGGSAHRAFEFIRSDEGPIAPVRAFREALDRGRFPRFVGAVDVAAKRPREQRDGHSTAEALARELVALKMCADWRLAVGTCDGWGGWATRSWLEVGEWIFLAAYIWPMFTPRSFFFGNNLSPTDAQTFELTDIAGWRKAVREHRPNRTKGNA